MRAALPSLPSLVHQRSPYKAFYTKLAVQWRTISELLRPFSSSFITRSHLPNTKLRSPFCLLKQVEHCFLLTQNHPSHVASGNLFLPARHESSCQAREESSAGRKLGAGRPHLPCLSSLQYACTPCKIIGIFYPGTFAYYSTVLR